MTDPHREFDVAVIGAGASGALLAAQFLHTAPPDKKLALVEAGARAARGLAYGTPYGAHLLNVPAGKMSALPWEPDHFVRWLRVRLPDSNAGTFAPRALYGDYLASALEDHTQGFASLARVAGTAVGLTRGEDGWTVHLHDGRQFGARAIVLALGNLPPEDPLHLGETAPEAYLRDPWGPGVGLGLAPDAPVLLIGTGLTMVDVVLVLREEGHRGPIHALSRHGYLPQSHTSSPGQGSTRSAEVDASEGHASEEPAELLPTRGESPRGGSPRSTARRLRNEIEKAEREGRDWRSVVDDLRPYTSDIWRSWSEAERASFLRHAKTLWDAHRHRVAPEVFAQIAALIEQGTLAIHRGRILSLREVEAGVEVRWRSRGTSEVVTLRAARVVNCTGPASDYTKVDLPLVVELRRAGWLTPDSLGLGVRTDEDGRLLASDESTVEGLFTIGPLRKPSLWESTAIPEIRSQAAALATVLLSDEREDPHGPEPQGRP